MPGGWDRPESRGATRTSTPQWRKTRGVVLARDRHRCQLRIAGVCTGHATEVDHRVSHADGGTDDLSNLRSVCTPCHRKVTSAQGNAKRHRGSARRPTDVHPGILLP